MCTQTTGKAKPRRPSLNHSFLHPRKMSDPSIHPPRFLIDDRHAAFDLQEEEEELKEEVPVVLQ